jgi:hypothetical protein
VANVELAVAKRSCATQGGAALTVRKRRAEACRWGAQTLKSVGTQQYQLTHSPAGQRVAGGVARCKSGTGQQQSEARWENKVQANTAMQQQRVKYGIGRQRNGMHRLHRLAAAGQEPPTCTTFSMGGRLAWSHR